MGSAVMPQLRDESFTCFVHGHGANYSSAPIAESKLGSRQRLVTPITRISSNQRAEAQLAFQQRAGKAPENNQKT
jgi:hypothetical protein